MSSPGPFFSGIVPFCRKDPKSWFRQLEANFAIHKIADEDSKYVYLQAKLEPAILSEISDFFEKPPTDSKYTAAKNHILAQYEDSREQQVTKVLEDLTLGDRRPSELLREMLKFAANDLSEDALRSIFLKRLPADVGAVLVGSSESLPRLGELADKVHRFIATSTPHSTAAITTTVPAPTVAAVKADENQHLYRMLATLTESIAALSNRIAQLEIAHQPRNRERSLTPQNNRDRSRSSSRNFRVPENSKLCYYHYRFMGKAKNCKPLPDGTACKWGNLNA